MSYVIFLSAPVGAAAMLPSRSYNYCILLFGRLGNGHGKILSLGNFSISK